MVAVVEPSLRCNYDGLLVGRRWYSRSNNLALLTTYTEVYIEAYTEVHIEAYIGVYI